MTMLSTFMCVMVMLKQNLIAAIDVPKAHVTLS